MITKHTLQMLVKMGLRLFTRIMILQAITGDQKQTILIHEIAIRVGLLPTEDTCPEISGSIQGHNMWQ